MHVMMVNLVTILLSAALIVYADDGGGELNPVITNADVKTDVLDIMKDHFDRSLNYLYTGVQYDSQYGERPGLAKKLRAMSDAQWEAGMAALNKYLEHGGSTNEEFIKKLAFKGGETCNLMETGGKKSGEIYMGTLETLKTDSQSLLAHYKSVYTRAINDKDGDIVHYLEEKIEKELEHHHELMGHITTLSGMNGIGAAVAAFDSNL